MHGMDTRGRGCNFGAPGLLSHDRSDAAATRQPRAENGIQFGDIVTKTPRDIHYGDQEGFFADGHGRHLLKEALLFDEHAVGRRGEQW
jgi:hypothetical protein